MRYVSTAAQLANLLEAKPSGNGYVAQCPAHNDHNPSLSIWQDESGVVAFKCHGGCDHGKVQSAFKAQQIFVQPPPNGRHYEPTGLSTKAKPDASEVRRRAIKTWNSSRRADKVGHPYLDAKQIGGKGLRVTDDRVLLVPLRDLEGQLLSLQRIMDTGGGVVKKSAANPKGRARSKWSKLTLDGTDLGQDIAFQCGEYEGRIYVCEGMADAVSIGTSVSGLCVATAGVGRLTQIARALRSKYPDAEIVIAADNDEAGLKAAHEAAVLASAKIAVPSIPNREGKVDFNDVFRERSSKAVRKQLGQATPVEAASSTDAMVGELAKMSPIEYGVARKAVAEKLGIEARFLDKEVEERRRKLKAQGDSTKLAGQAVALAEPTPWHEPVDGDELLQELVEAVRQHLVVSDHAAVAVALWCVLTYSVDHFDISPRLVLTSAEMRCGKTRALELIGCLSNKTITTSNITTAALFRVIEQHKPTVLIDEADTFVKLREELRGILNSGHSRSGAYVWRVVGDAHDVRQFNTWGAVAIALIGTLHATLRDRSIEIPMIRKRTDQSVAKISKKRRERLAEITQHIARFVQDDGQEIENAKVKRIPHLNDRAWDNWKPLAKIARVAGGDWPRRVRTAAQALSSADRDKDSVAVTLLRDLQELFKTKKAEQLSTTTILDHLHELEDRPWPEWRNSQPLTPRQLAQLLKPFKIGPVQFRIGAEIVRGYERDAFSDTWARYVENEAPA